MKWKCAKCGEEKESDLAGSVCDPCWEKFWDELAAWMKENPEKAAKMPLACCDARKEKN